MPFKASVETTQIRYKTDSPILLRSKKKLGEAHSDGRFFTKTPTSTKSFISFFATCSIDFETVYAREQKGLDPGFNFNETGGPGTQPSLPLNNSLYFEKRLRKAFCCSVV